MAIEGIPTLGDQLNPLIAPLKAKDIMNRHFYSVRQLDTLNNLLDVLDSSKSMLLPVITRQGKFVGMILRRNVIYALKYGNKYMSESEVTEDDLARDKVHLTSASAIEKKMGGWDDRTDYAKSLGTFDEKYANALINLTPFMDAGQRTKREPDERRQSASARL